MCSPSTTFLRPRSIAPPKIPDTTPLRWCFPPNTIRRPSSPSAAGWTKSYFGLHHDLPPEAIALRLGGTLVWKREDEGMWMALIRFNRRFEARLVPAAKTPGNGPTERKRL